MKWFVIGISGVTCGGKTTISRLLHRVFPWAHVINQDTYFYPEGSEHHILLPDVNHNNWEILSSMDMDRMWKDIMTLLSSEPEVKDPSSVTWPNLAGSIDHITLGDELVEELKKEFSNVSILLLDGMLLFNYKPIADLCDVKYYITVGKEVCWARRSERTYDPPDPPGYFEKVVWPMFGKNWDEVKANVTGVSYCDGEKDMEEMFYSVLEEVKQKLRSQCMCSSRKKLK